MPVSNIGPRTRPSRPQLFGVTDLKSLLILLNNKKDYGAKVAELQALLQECDEKIEALGGLEDVAKLRNAAEQAKEKAEAVLTTASREAEKVAEAAQLRADEFVEAAETKLAEERESLDEREDALRYERAEFIRIRDHRQAKMLKREKAVAKDEADVEARGVTVDAQLARAHELLRRGEAVQAEQEAKAAEIDRIMKR